MTSERIALGGISGNYDSTVATDYRHCGCKYEDPEQEKLSHVSYEWTKANVSAETKAALGARPFRLDIAPLGGHLFGRRVILVHGTPTMNTLYWTEDRPDSFCTQMANIAGAKKGDTAHSPDIDGCIAAGTTIEETESLMREALQLHISAMRDAGEKIPEVRTYATTVAIPNYSAVSIPR